MLELVEPVAKRFNEEGKFLGIGFGRSSLCECVPVRVGKLGAIRVAGVGHSRTLILRIGATNPCSRSNSFWLGTVCTLRLRMGYSNRAPPFSEWPFCICSGERLVRLFCLSATSLELGDPMLYVTIRKDSSALKPG